MPSHRVRMSKISRDAVYARAMAGAAAPVSTPSLSTEEGRLRVVRLFVARVAVICRCSLCSWSCSEKRDREGAAKYLSSSCERKGSSGASELRRSWDVVILLYDNIM